MKPVIIIALAVVIIIAVVVGIAISMNVMEETRNANFVANLNRCDYILPNVNFMNPNSIEVSREWERCYDQTISKYGTSADKLQWGLDKQELELVRQNPHGTDDPCTDMYEMKDTSYSGIQNQIKLIERCRESELYPITDFAGCVYDAEKGWQYYVDRYYKEKTYKDWFDERFFPITIIEAVDFAESKTDEKLITVDWLTNAEYYSIKYSSPGGCNDHAEQRIDFAGCVYDAKQGGQYYVDRYDDEKTYRDWFDERFFPITIIEAVDFAESKTVKGLITTPRLTNAEYYSAEWGD